MYITDRHGQTIRVWEGRDLRAGPDSGHPDFFLCEFILRAKKLPGM